MGGTDWSVTRLSTTDLFQAALRFAERGWLVMPCRPGEKVPATANGLKDASSDWDQIISWWGRIPQCNVAVCTGAESGFVVLDVDGDAGAESLTELEREHGQLPSTLSVVTPSGGQHYYFTHPGEEFRNSAGKLGAGLDIRGDGGYVLAPPSRLKGGVSYEADARVPMAAVPEWLAELSQRHLNGGEAQSTGEWLDIAGGVQEGSRNHAIARLTGHLLRRYVDVELVHDLVSLVNRTRFLPPLADWEVRRTVDSIFERELERRARHEAAQKERTGSLSRA
jgi:hypothetical protein